MNKNTIYYKNKPYKLKAIKSNTYLLACYKCAFSSQVNEGEPIVIGRTIDKNICSILNDIRSESSIPENRLKALLNNCNYGGYFYEEVIIYPKKKLKFDDN